MLSAEPDEEFRSFTLSIINDLRARMDEMTATLDLLERRILAAPEPIGADIVDVVEPDPTIQPLAGASLPPLREWQRDALADWADAGRRGVVEAVTGSGKTRLGVEAVLAALEAGQNSLIIVPTIDLQRQWYDVLSAALEGVRISRLGGGSQDQVPDSPVVVGVVNSVTSALSAGRLRPGGLLIADECHRYATEVFNQALHPQFDWRLGLTATYERDDDGHRRFLDAYFGGVVFRLWYDRALKDKVIAPFEVTLVGVDLMPRESADYQELSDRWTFALLRRTGSGEGTV
ncbi:MAG: DEAD/DEAH box helicase family protein [Actinomycetota bacterium]|nr:DEAD/DEAH box helicase family protein [Actinomycetota bacterium]